MNEYNPKPGDVEKLLHYPSGKLEERRYENKDLPANGWSLTRFFETGQPRSESCFSHSLLIEQIEYDEEGEVVSHKIYSHGKKQLIDKPVVQPLPRPNVVTGFGHMGFYYKNLPAIAAFIEADYDEASLEKAYKNYLADVDTYELTDEDYEEREYRWSLKGKRMSFALWFEKHEMLFQWHVWAKSEEEYEEAKSFMEMLKEQ